MDTESNAPRIIAICVSTLVMAVSCIALRIFIRLVIIKYVGWDDWLILAAGLCSIGASTATAIRTKYGLGRHIWTVPVSDFEPDMKTFYVIMIYYNVGQILVKISVMCLYLRIFLLPAMNKICRFALGIVVIYGISIMGIEIFSCTPILYFWDKSISGYCFPEKTVCYVAPALNVLTNIAIFTLPLPMLTRLTLPRGQKIGLISTFLLGFFVCIVSMIRIKALVITTNSTDPTWDGEASATWTIIELNIGIICGCLPTLKPLVAKFKTHFSSTEDTCFDIANISNSHVHQLGPS